MDSLAVTAALITDPELHRHSCLDVSCGIILEVKLRLAPRIGQVRHCDIATGCQVSYVLPHLHYASCADVDQLMSKP